MLGYLLGGAIVGPYALSLISDVNSVKHLAEIGVVLLLFNIGGAGRRRCRGLGWAAMRRKQGRKAAVRWQGGRQGGGGGQRPSNHQQQ